MLGAGGQIGRALVAALPAVRACSRQAVDITDPERAGIDWSAYDTLINAAAYTDVDGSETRAGRALAWRTNAEGPAALATIARAYGLTLVHLSSEYVFDGHRPGPIGEDCPIAPLNAYGASKAAGDVAVRTLPTHYIVRPTWVVGEGRNFVATMLALARRRVSPTVVHDQIGRPTFAPDVAAAILRLVTSGAPYGTYHVTGGGDPASFAEVARATYELAGHGDLVVRETSTQAYLEGRSDVARRPLNSVLALEKAERAGLRMRPWREGLAAYVAAERAATGAGVARS